MSGSTDSPGRNREASRLPYVLLCMQKCLLLAGPRAVACSCRRCKAACIPRFFAGTVWVQRKPPWLFSRSQHPQLVLLGRQQQRGLCGWQRLAADPANCQCGLIFGRGHQS